MKFEPEGITPATFFRSQRSYYSQSKYNIHKRGRRSSSSLLRVISVDSLVLRGSSGVDANFLRLLGIHTQNLGKCEQSWKNQPPHPGGDPGGHSPAYVPYAWKPVSHANRAITPTFLSSLFRQCGEYVPYSLLPYRVHTCP
jgi:hypothetical protein